MQGVVTLHREVRQEPDHTPSKFRNNAAISPLPTGTSLLRVCCLSCAATQSRQAVIYILGGLACNARNAPAVQAAAAATAQHESALRLRCASAAHGPVPAPGGTTANLP